MTKYIFVTGGVTSSLGKGIISASLAKLLQARGFSITIQQIIGETPLRINVDPCGDTIRVDAFSEPVTWSPKSLHLSFRGNP